MADSVWRKQLSKAVAYGKKNGLAGVCHRAVRKLWLSVPVSYETWLRWHSAGKRELQRQRNSAHEEEPLVLACILPGETGEKPVPSGLDKKYRETTESSLAGQTYGKLAICPDLNVFGPDRPLRDNRYFLLLEQGVILRPEAVWTFIREAQAHPETDLFYCDHDRIRDDGKLSDPFCKPQFDPVFLESFNYIGPLCLIKDRGLQRLQELVAEREQLQDMQSQGVVQLQDMQPQGMQKQDMRLQGVQNQEKQLQEGQPEHSQSRTVADIGIYGVLKLLAEMDSAGIRIYRIPEILYHVSEDADPGTVLLQTDSSENTDFKVSPLCKKTDRIDTEGTISMAERPLLSVIIPNRDHAEDLRACVESLLERGGYENLEILIVENHSEEQATQALYTELTQRKNIRVLIWEEPFQYAALNNFAAAQARGTYLLFLNNDTRIHREGSIAELMRMGTRRQVGAVGARLLYDDGTIQHAGVVLGYGGIAGHAFAGVPDEIYEKTVYARAPRQMAAVTAACMLVKKEAFDAVGGFTEALAVAYNDIDFCMKLRAACWMTVYDPFAQLYHLESQTRGLELTQEKAQRVRQEAELFCNRWQKELDAGDPFYNPNLTLEKPDFSLKR